MKQPLTSSPRSPYVSLGLFAWNEERGIASALESLFRQTLFRELARRRYACEVICVSNGCTDRTAAVAAETFAEQNRLIPFPDYIIARVVDLSQRGKLNAWNQFVHCHSAKEARYLFMMDADILLNQRETLWNMLQTLEREGQAQISV